MVVGLTSLAALISVWFFLMRPDLEITKFEMSLVREKDEKMVHSKFQVTNTGNSDLKNQVLVELKQDGKVVKEITITSLTKGESQEHELSFVQTEAGNYTYQIQIDPSGNLLELSKENNSSSSLLEVPEDLPDLVIKDINYDGQTAIYVNYCNHWSGSTDNKMQIMASTQYRTYNGNSYYPLPVPDPDECWEVFVHLDYLGVDNTEVVDVTVEIDSENVIAEHDETNNRIIKKIDFTPREVCRDDDGGRDYYTKGCAASASRGGLCDCCRKDKQSTNCVPVGKYLLEAICVDEIGGAEREFYECPNKCVQGACVE